MQSAKRHAARSRLQFMVVGAIPRIHGIIRFTMDLADSHLRSERSVSLVLLLPSTLAGVGRHTA